MLEKGRISISLSSSSAFLRDLCNACSQNRRIIHVPGGIVGGGGPSEMKQNEKKVRKMLWFGSRSSRKFASMGPRNGSNIA